MANPNPDPDHDHGPGPNPKIYSMAEPCTDNTKAEYVLGLLQALLEAPLKPTAEERARMLAEEKERIERAQEEERAAEAQKQALTYPNPNWRRRRDSMPRTVLMRLGNSGTP